MNLALASMSAGSASRRVTATSSPVLACTMARGFERRAAIADPVACKVQFPFGVRQRDIDDLKVGPIEPCLLLPDRLGHFRLRLECDDTAGAADGAQHPEAVDSLVGADVECGRAVEIELHQGLDLELLGMKPVAHAAGEEMAVSKEVDRKATPLVSRKCAGPAVVRHLPGRHHRCTAKATRLWQSAWSMPVAVAFGKSPRAARQNEAQALFCSNCIAIDGIG